MGGGPPEAVVASISSDRYLRRGHTREGLASLDLLVLLLNHLVRRNNECLRLHQYLVKHLFLHLILNPQSHDLPLFLILLLAVLVPLLVVFEPLLEVFSDDSFIETIN